MIRSQQSHPILSGDFSAITAIESRNSLDDFYGHIALGEHGPASLMSLLG